MAGWMQFKIDNVMKKTAKDFVNKFKKNDFGKLDYSPKSLLILDRILDMMKEYGATTSYLESCDELWFPGSYLGEVVRKQTGGDWIGISEFYSLNQSSPIRLLKIGDYYTSPISEIAWKLDIGPENRFMLYYQLVTNEVLTVNASLKNKVKVDHSVFLFLFPEYFMNQIIKYR